MLLAHVFWALNYDVNTLPLKLSTGSRGAAGHMDRTLVASWTPYDWRRAHERGSGSEDTTVGDWREAIRTKVKGP